MRISASKTSHMASGHSRRSVRISASASGPSRRGMLIGGGFIAASPLIFIRKAEAAKRLLPVESLSSFQRSDQREEYIKRATTVLKDVLSGEDAPAAVRLALHDAGTYDILTKTGGLDGSIILNSKEAGEPFNSTLGPIVAKLKAAKQTIDAGDKNGAGPISYADLIYLGGRTAVRKHWFALKAARTAQAVRGDANIASQFINPWPTEIGRVDSAEYAGAAIPALDADVETIRAWLTQLGAKPGAGSGPFTPKPPFWEQPGFVLWTAAALDPAAEEARFVAANPDAYGNIKTGYDRSRATVTSTNYEMDFADYFNKMSRLGAKFNSNQYLYPIPIQSI